MLHHIGHGFHQALVCVCVCVCVCVVDCHTSSLQCDTQENSSNVNPSGIYHSNDKKHKSFHYFRKAAI